MQVHLLGEAEQDLLEIYAYIAADDERNAESFVRELRRKIASLRHMPDAHPLVGVGDVRRRIHGRYRIFFRLNPEFDRVDIVRVLHSSRNIDFLKFL